MLEHLDTDRFDETLEAMPPGIYVLFWDIRKSTDQETREPLTKMARRINCRIYDALNKGLMDFDKDCTNDENLAVCQDFETAMEVSRIVAKGFAPQFLVRIGCDTNAGGKLMRGKLSGRLSGRAFEYAKRMVDFFKELRNPLAWKPDATGNREANENVPREPSTSYLVLSEQAYRLAQDTRQLRSPNDFVRLQGLYTPRVRGAYSINIYLKTFQHE